MHTHTRTHTHTHNTHTPSFKHPFSHATCVQGKELAEKAISTIQKALYYLHNMVRASLLQALTHMHTTHALTVWHV